MGGWGVAEARNEGTSGFAGAREGGTGSKVAGVWWGVTGPPTRR